MPVKRYDAVDSLRGVAAVFVLILHVKVSTVFYEDEFFRAAGYFVEFFFVLSGFVIAHYLLRKNHVSSMEFVIGRIFRIFPLHLFTLAFFIFLECMKLAAETFWSYTFTDESFTNDFSLLELPFNIFLVHSWFDFTESHSFNYVSWSLSVEFFLYLLVGFFYFLNCRTGPIFFIFLFGFILLYVDDLFFQRELARGLFCFSLGWIVYLFRQVFIRFPKESTVYEISIVLLIYFLLSNSEIFNVFVFGISFALAIFIFSYERGLISNLLKTKIFKFLGKHSFSIYLVHPIILSFTTSGVLIIERIYGVNYYNFQNGERVLDGGSALINYGVVFAIVVTVLAMSALTYRFVEVPGINFGRNILRHLDSDIDLSRES